MSTLPDSIRDAIDRAARQVLRRARSAFDPEVSIDQGLDSFTTDITDELETAVMEWVKRGDDYRAVLIEVEGLIEDDMAGVAQEIVREALRDRT